MYNSREISLVLRLAVRLDISPYLENASQTFKFLIFSFSLMQHFNNSALISPCWMRPALFCWVVAALFCVFPLSTASIN